MRTSLFRCMKRSRGPPSTNSSTMISTNTKTATPATFCPSGTAPSLIPLRELTLMAGTLPGGANGRVLQSRTGLGSSPAWSSFYSDSLGKELSSLTPHLPSLAQRGAQSWQEVNTQEIREKQMGSSSMSTINSSKRPAQYFEFLDCKKESKKPGRHEEGISSHSSSQQPCSLARADFPFQREYTYFPRLVHKRRRGTRCVYGRPVSSCWLPQRRPVGEKDKEMSRAGLHWSDPKGAQLRGKSVDPRKGHHCPHPKP